MISVQEIKSPLGRKLLDNTFEAIIDEDSRQTQNELAGTLRWHEKQFSVDWNPWEKLKSKVVK